MASRDPFPPSTVPEAEFTTNEEDRLEAAKLQARLNEGGKRSWGADAVCLPVPHVQIDKGAHKYVLIRAQRRGDPEYFVTSRKGAHYHRNAAEPLVELLESAGYNDIRVTGGGRISWDKDSKKISIFGFSYSFGQGDHARSRQVILNDPRFKDYEVTISNSGY